MGIRNSIVNPFDLKTDRNERINRNAEIVIGKKKNHASNLPPPFTNENPIFKHLGKGLTLIWTCFTENPELLNSKNYFVFSFYTRGMNFADMMNLKDIMGETFTWGELIYNTDKSASATNYNKG